MSLWISGRDVSLRRSFTKSLSIAPLLIGLFSSLLSFSNLLADQEAEHIIRMVNEQYDGIKTIGGVIDKRIQSEGKTQKVTGRFLIKRPDKSYVEFADPHQIVCSNDSLCWVEKVEENVVLKFHIAKMNRFEKEALGIGGLLGLNVFEQLRDGFRFSLLDTLNGDLVISAQPKSGGEIISKILIKVDPKKWVILAYEIFDLKGKLVSQTKYEDYILYGDSLFFPNRVTTKSIYKGETLAETDNFSRVRLNQAILDDNFEFTPPKDAEIVTPEGVMERR